MRLIERVICDLHVLEHWESTKGKALGFPCVHCILHLLFCLSCQVFQADNSRSFAAFSKQIFYYSLPNLLIWVGSLCICMCPPKSLDLFRCQLYNGFSAITVSMRFHCTVPELLKVPRQFSGQQEGHLGSETQYSPLTSLKFKTSSDISCAYQLAFMVCYW